MSYNFKYKSGIPSNSEPGGIIRWGTGFVFLLFLFVFILSSFLSYNQIIRGSVTVTSKNPPVQIKAKSSGQVFLQGISAGDTVDAGAILAVVENSAILNDVIQLKEKLRVDNLNIASIPMLISKFPPHLILGGDIKSSFNMFLVTYQNFILENLLREEQLIQLQLRNQFSSRGGEFSRKEEELKVQRNALKLEEKNLERHKMLYAKGVISQYDLEKVENELLSKSRDYIILDQELLRLQGELAEISVHQELQKGSSTKKENQRLSDLLIAKQNLVNSIHEWEEKYLIITPVSGRLSLNHIYGNLQNINAGEVLFTIVSLDQQDLIGKCKIPVKRSGGVKEGQEVFLKMDNYPYREWGVIKAKVKSISGIQEVNEEKSYIVYLDVENLSTSYGKILKLDQDLNGTAEILLEEITLLERIFYQIRS